VVFTAMTTWKTGRRILADRLQETTLPVDLFLDGLRIDPPVRVRGTAVFMSGSPDGVPPALLHNLKHNKVLHETVVLLRVDTEEVPHVPEAERVTLDELGSGIFRIVMHYGFMEDPDVPAVLAAVRHPGLAFPEMDTTFFLGRETLIASSRPGMAIWRERLFSVMARNARTATSFFALPPNRVVELGAQIEL
jgi:KUP system potassium uptake protein